MTAIPHTEALRMTERYRRRNFGSLELEVTLSDPAAYARPWTIAVRAELAADTEMIEWVCNESSHNLERWVGKASDERKGEVQVAPEILAKYVGTYKEQAPLWRNVPTSRGDHVLGWQAVRRHGRQREGTPDRQVRDSFRGFVWTRRRVHLIQGGAGGLFVKHVSGDYRFARQ